MSAWGARWGNRWGGRWGAVAGVVAAQPQPQLGGGGTTGGPLRHDRQGRESHREGDDGRHLQGGPNLEHLALQEEIERELGATAQARAVVLERDGHAALIEEVERFVGQVDARISGMEATAAEVEQLQMWLQARRDARRDADKATALALAIEIEAEEFLLLVS